MRTRKKYPIDQSPLYKLSNHKRLAKILAVQPSTLKKLVARGDANYKFGSVGDEDPRDIEIPKAQLLRIHKRLNSLLNRIEKPDYLMSGVRGRSHVDNAKRHLGHHAVVKVDIKKFYPSTTKSIVSRGLRKTFRCSEDIAETLAELSTVRSYIPTGSPLSQSMAFMVNLPAFNHINAYSRSRNLRFTLYVDDLTFSGEKIPKDFVSYVQNYLKNSRGYGSHKIRRYSASTEKVITGVVLDGNNAKVKRTQRRVIASLYRSIPYYCEPVRREDAATIKFFQRIIGHLFSAGEISPGYRNLGAKTVAKRKAAGVRAQNQNTI
ncbi:reverse transcriptase family protein [Marinobacter xiaoshiensis]|uniref:Reverse transcriptase family protein n=1 Tax=Marinobacter xiaoshiensis TaxID=3073652 RepID=A0ABU2HHJ7_9GAMM|nr:reverse transcriptase family protein [Marinobacter sp. F60267]MDS1310548.1 reverse transcriptase family protein [Marinobacter sp. F60267]